MKPYGAQHYTLKRRLSNRPMLHDALAGRAIKKRARRIVKLSLKRYLSVR